MNPESQKAETTLPHLQKANHYPPLFTLLILRLLWILLLLFLLNLFLWILQSINILIPESKFILKISKLLNPIIQSTKYYQIYFWLSTKYQEFRFIMTILKIFLLLLLLLLLRVVKHFLLFCKDELKFFVQYTLIGYFLILFLRYKMLYNHLSNMKRILTVSPSL